MFTRKFGTKAVWEKTEKNQMGHQMEDKGLYTEKRGHFINQKPEK